jgi:tRNA A-37 threonylcarbamoyl transferase component Bud32
MAQASFDEACPAEDAIAAFVGGCLAAPQRAALEAHVAGCDACRRLLSALARAAGSEAPGADDSMAPTRPSGSGTSDAELPPGARFGRYLVVDWLGAGGMGVVYSAYDADLNRKVALKVLRHDGIDPRPSRDLLVAEAQAMAQLTHPNVVTVFDVGRVDDRVFLAMELIEGQTLAGWLRATRRKPGEILARFVAAGHGLAAAHAAGLIHRDFKPDNVLVGHDGRVCVTDFGLARRATPSTDARDSSQTGLAGTLAYMAPEQYLGRSVDARADQFSFAVGLYEALYGERPFASPPGSGDPPVETTPPVRGVPLALHQVLLRALRRDPDERYPSITELLAALTPPPRRSRSLVVAAIASLVGAALASTALVVLLVSAGTASADASGCTTGTSSGNVETCVSIIGSGLLIDEITASATVENATRTIQVCIHGPDSALPRCTAFEVVHPGSTITEPWFPDRDVPAGSYCARTWRENADGSHTMIGEECKDVHR